MKINILDSSVYNRISAGEVVENPASVVKELAENSIDAGATLVVIRIEDGGLKKIQVEDNGIGILKEELYKTILPHATSKIETAADLDAIGTLGFRGEALASIAAVSDFEIRSHYTDADMAAILTARNGVTHLVDAAGAAPGTRVTVSALFFNTPARYKFLKKPRAETAAVTTAVGQLILGNPGVAFQYYADNALILSADGSGLPAAIAAVYGKAHFEKMLPVFSTKETGALQIGGYISPPNDTKHNKSFQTVVVNGRVVADAGLSASVQNAYGERLMHRSFPLYVLNIVMPFDEVDVNAHPNKKEVRFADARAVYGAAYRAVRDTLELYEATVRGEITGALNWSATALAEPEQARQAGESAPKNNNAQLSTVQNIIGGCLLENISPAGAISDAGDRLLPPFRPPLFNKAQDEAVVHTGQPEVELFAGEPLDTAVHSGQPIIEGIAPHREIFRYVGQAFTTYLILETKDCLYIVDQHAAHERILYDEFLKNLESGTVAVQPFLIPYLFEDAPETVAAIIEFFPMLREIGFDIEEFGHATVKINGVPAALGGMQLDRFLTALSSFKKGKDLTVGDFARESLAREACRAAIKAGDILSEKEIEFLTTEYFAKNMPLQCPHGRPAYFTVTKTDLEKKFRRKQ